MNLTIEPIRQKDIPLLYAMIQELAEFEELTDLFTGTEEQLNTALFGNTPAVEGLLAWVDDRAVGYSLFFQNFSTFQCLPGLYLEDLYVKPEYRGQGIGKALFNKVYQIGQARGCGRLEWLVINWNSRAKTFYESLGATIYEKFQLCRMTY